MAGNEAGIFEFVGIAQRERDLPAGFRLDAGRLETIVPPASLMAIWTALDSFAGFAVRHRLGRAMLMHGMTAGRLSGCGRCGKRGGQSKGEALHTIRPAHQACAAVGV